MNAQTFVLHDISSQNTILFRWLVPWHLQMVGTFLNDFQISHSTWPCLQQIQSDRHFHQTVTRRNRSSTDNNNNNKAILTSPMLCTPITPSRPIPFAVNTAATEWSVLQLHDVICSEHITMHCQWGGKPPKLPLPLGISSPCCRRTEPQATCTKIW